jgi:hypothetical protein
VCGGLEIFDDEGAFFFGLQMWYNGQHAHLESGRSWVRVTVGQKKKKMVFAASLLCMQH